MNDIEKILLENRAWVQEKVSVNPNYFKELAKDQTPNFLWIGCSDSRVPPNELIGANPGDLFVHRNVANLIVHTDMNLMSVVEYAIEQLKVKHVIVCGHYGCGGVKAAMGNKSLGTINKWIRNIKDIYRTYASDLEKIKEEKARFDRLVELNIIEQAKNLTHTSLVQRAWSRGQELYIHGFVYALDSGLLKPLATIDKTYPVEDIYRYEF